MTPQKMPLQKMPLNAQQQKRLQRLNEALRANLKRRKQAQISEPQIELEISQPIDDIAEESILKND